MNGKITVSYIEFLSFTRRSSASITFSLSLSTKQTIKILLPVSISNFRQKLFHSSNLHRWIKNQYPENTRQKGIIMYLIIEGSRPINSLKNEQDWGRTTAIKTFTFKLRKVWRKDFGEIIRSPISNVWLSSFRSTVFLFSMTVVLSSYRQRR